MNQCDFVYGQPLSLSFIESIYVDQKAKNDVTHRTLYCITVLHNIYPIKSNYHPMSKKGWGSALRRKTTIW